MTTLIVMALLTVLFLGPLLWRARRDTLEDRALELQADIQAAVNHRLGGESLVAVRVVAGVQRGTGTVENLFAGHGCGLLRWLELLEVARCESRFPE